MGWREHLANCDPDSGIVLEWDRRHPDDPFFSSRYHLRHSTSWSPSDRGLLVRIQGAFLTMPNGPLEGKSPDYVAIHESGMAICHYEQRENGITHGGMVVFFPREYTAELDETLLEYFAGRYPGKFPEIAQRLEQLPRGPPVEEHFPIGMQLKLF